VAIELRKFPHEVRELMDMDDFNFILGHMFAEQQEEQEASGRAQQKAKENPKSRPQTMGTE